MRRRGKNCQMKIGGLAGLGDEDGRSSEEAFLKILMRCSEKWKK